MGFLRPFLQADAATQHKASHHPAKVPPVLFVLINKHEEPEEEKEISTCR